MALSESLRSFAEEPETHLRDVPGVAFHLRTPKYVLQMSPSPLQSGTCRIRTTEAELDSTIAETRGLLRERGYKANVWHVAPSSRPEKLGALLRARGFIPATKPPYEPTLTVMALAEPPKSTPNAGIETRIARNFEEYLAGLEVALEAFGESEEGREGWRAAAPRLWESQDGVDRFTHVAFLDGQPVGVGFSACGSSGILMGGAGVLPSARGRGVYRALVAARWSETERLGKQGLAIQAGAMSRPILERCGFQKLCELELLEDMGLG